MEELRPHLAKCKDLQENRVSVSLVSAAVEEEVDLVLKTETRFAVLALKKAFRR